MSALRPVWENVSFSAADDPRRTLPRPATTNPFSNSTSLPSATFSQTTGSLGSSTTVPRSRTAAQPLPHVLSRQQQFSTRGELERRRVGNAVPHPEAHLPGYAGHRPHHWNVSDYNLKHLAQAQKDADAGRTVGPPPRPQSPDPMLTGKRRFDHTAQESHINFNILLGDTRQRRAADTSAADDSFAASTAETYLKGRSRRSYGPDTRTPFVSKGVSPLPAATLTRSIHLPGLLGETDVERADLKPVPRYQGHVPRHNVRRYHVPEEGNSVLRVFS